jgi:hypothetical protein
MFYSDCVFLVPAYHDSQTPWASQIFPLFEEKKPKILAKHLMEFKRPFRLHADFVHLKPHSLQRKASFACRPVT